MERSWRVRVRWWDMAGFLEACMIFGWFMDRDFGVWCLPPCCCCCCCCCCWLFRCRCCFCCCKCVVEGDNFHRWISLVFPAVASTSTVDDDGLPSGLILSLAPSGSECAYGRSETEYRGAALPLPSEPLCHSIWGVSILMFSIAGKNRENDLFCDSYCSRFTIELNSCVLRKIRLN